MATYYDPVYGQIELDNCVMDIVSKCPELKRLRFIGMMNFKSISMLSLTSISRLEHSIGLTHLIQLLTKTNPNLQSINHDLLVSGLYHDVNCGSYGHSVEWAIDRHVNYEHESDADWVKTDEVLANLKNKPIFIEQDGLHRHGFHDKYSLNFERIDNIINGNGHYIINNSGMDLDNIDNVFRMAHYLGFLKKSNTPIELVKSLRVIEGRNNFSISEEKAHLIEEWMNLRTKVYRHFIYSDEYMAFEYLIFELVSEYASTLVNVEDIKNIFHYTDESLLWLFYEMKRTRPKLASLAKRLLLHDLPFCYGIMRSSSIEMDNPLRDKSTRKMLSEKISNKLKNLNLDINMHMTTDNRKTNRKIDFFISGENKFELTHRGEDKQYILLAILGNNEIDPGLAKKVTHLAVEVLEKEGFSDLEVTSSYNTDTPQKSLF
ncbi:MAG: hypothetical protein OQL20_01670 [Sedimenticola sp.]|nr:hypothetical protein [Sedimenticola sp.]